MLERSTDHWNLNVFVCLALSFEFAVQCVGQFIHVQRSALGRAEVYVTVFCRIALQDSQQFDVLAGLCCDHHIAHRAAMHGGKQRSARCRDFIAAQRQAVKPALEFAKILHSRNDFLTGIAALFEADAADRLQIDHLRDEFLAGTAEHLTDTDSDLTQQPVIQRAFGQL